MLEIFHSIGLWVVGLVAFYFSRATKTGPHSEGLVVAGLPLVGAFAFLFGLLFPGVALYAALLGSSVFLASSVEMWLEESGEVQR